MRRNLVANIFKPMCTGFYYGGYGFMLLPSVGIIETYGGQTAEYHNAFAFYQLSV